MYWSLNRCTSSPPPPPPLPHDVSPPVGPSFGRTAVAAAEAVVSSAVASAPKGPLKVAPEHTRRERVALSLLISTFHFGEIKTFHLI